MKDLLIACRSRRWWFVVGAKTAWSLASYLCGLGFRYEVEDIVCEGEKVTVRDVFRGTHRGDFVGILATGKRLTMKAIHIYRLSEASQRSTG